MQEFSQQDLNHFRGPDGTIRPYQPIVGGMNVHPAHPPGGFVGGFTPNYSPPSSSFQPTFPSPQFSPPSIHYDGMPPPPMDDPQPPLIRPTSISPSFPQLPNHPPPNNADPLDNMSPRTSISNSNSIPSMTAVERSRHLRIAKTTPHLQFMVGPLLRYDTIEGDLWKGAALIVSE